MDERASGGERSAPAGVPEAGGPNGRGRLLAGAFLALAVLVGVLGGIVIDRTLLTPPIAALAAGTTLPEADTGFAEVPPDTAAGARPTRGAATAPSEAGTRGGGRVERGRAAGARAIAGGQALAWMADSLDLSPDQRVRIATVVREEQRRARELTVRLRPRYQQLLRRTRLRVLAILTPEQRVRLRRLLAERGARRAERDSVARRPRR